MTSIAGGVGARWQPDGPVAYRHDPAGTLVALLPRHCRRGEHDLHDVGYQATEAGGVLRVSCAACTYATRADHAWALTVGSSHPARAELDDGPYAELRTRLTGQ